LLEGFRNLKEKFEKQLMDWSTSSCKKSCSRTLKIDNNQLENIYQSILLVTHKKVLKPLEENFCQYEY
jgi:hypothetical protein